MRKKGIRILIIFSLLLSLLVIPVSGGGNVVQEIDTSDGPGHNYQEAVFYLERYLQSLPPQAVEKRKKTELAIQFFKSKLS